MRFTSIYLSNYIGIYNGMGLYDIHIDMTRCQNRITIIRGDNGSGKSTLSKAMSLFPDSGDSFIPGLPARKEIVLVDGDVLYKLVFIHGVKQNGDRETTKAYISKSFNGNIVELNENGNVTSYKDILYSELGLDANFAALSQLSNDDRGLADKKPAERKRFVNSIIASLNTYNDIYKTLTKRSSNYKSMINAVSAKLGLLGDESALTSRLEHVENRINVLQDQKDQAVVALARQQSIVSLLDPDGSIQNTNTVISAELALAEKEYNDIQSIINSISASNDIELKDVAKGYKRILDLKNSIVIENQINRNTIESLISQKDAETETLNRKLHKLSQLQSGESYEVILERLEEYRVQMQLIKEELSSKVGLNDISAISREEYILALETLKDLESHISLFKSCVNFSIIENIITQYVSTGVLPTPIDISIYDNKIASLNTSHAEICMEILMIESKMGLLDKLNLRPASCKDNTCSFIKDAVEFSATNPNDRINELELLRKNIEADIEQNKEELCKANEYNNALNRFSIIVREINKNGAILSKMPNGEMFKNKALFFDRLLSGYGFEYMKSIYQYIDLANLLDTYRNLESIYNQYESERKVYESKAESLTELQEEIDSINQSISVIVDKINPINAEILDRERDIMVLTNIEAVYNTIMDNMSKQEPVSKKIQECKSKISENSRKINDINTAISKSTELANTIQQIGYSLDPLMKERDKLSHSFQMLKDYKAELEELKANYDFIESIKYYSSPTTGIQLVFMELYMGKIISLANELLKYLFGGQFVIQPFVINESEFRIPCLGGGYINDDISSMSSSQIGMISMILSFALLHHSSTKYNIIKLDEIDGPLDYSNRLYFMDVLNNIMDIMGTEQCIMISHNSELQVDNSDVILLRHDETNMDYQRGNIIWSY